MGSNWGKGKENIFGGKFPHSPCGAAIAPTSKSLCTEDAYISNQLDIAICLSLVNGSPQSQTKFRPVPA